MKNAFFEQLRLPWGSALFELRGKGSLLASLGLFCSIHPQKSELRRPLKIGVTAVASLAVFGAGRELVAGSPLLKVGYPSGGWDLRHRAKIKSRCSFRAGLFSEGGYVGCGAGLSAVACVCFLLRVKNPQESGTWWPCCRRGAALPLNTNARSFHFSLVPVAQGYPFY